MYKKVEENNKADEVKVEVAEDEYDTTERSVISRLMSFASNSGLGEILADLERADDNDNPIIIELLRSEAMKEAAWRLQGNN